jgi:hypothetical protein
LLLNQRGRIGLGSTINLNNYSGQLGSLGTLSGMQSGVYQTTMSNAMTGSYLNAGSSIFNGFSSYYNRYNYMNYSSQLQV